MSAAEPPASAPAPADRERTALDELVDREEVLQICYWYEGEGLGTALTAATLEPFLKSELRAVEAAIAELAERGDLVPATALAQGYHLSPQGKKKAGRLFADDFAEYQNAGHGECAAGCCDGDDHSGCGEDCTLH